jgi:ElaB/YqjD/DUF883 family membrane-anchored ribosome-binding protein
MFQYRSQSFRPHVSAIQHHLGAVEKEVETIGRLAGRRGSAAAMAASEQAGDVISGILSDLAARFRRGGAAARDEAARYGSRAFDLGSNYGNRALQHATSAVEDRPLIALGVAIGIGVLIGAAILRNTATSSSPRRTRR